MQSRLVRRTTTARVPTAEGTFQLSHYVDARDGKEHLALVMGDVRGNQNLLVRVHSECFTGDVLGSQRCDCGEQLHQAMQLIAQEKEGVIVYLRQEGRGIGLEAKLRAYNLQDQGYDTVDANLMLGHQADEREYSAAAAILSDLGIGSIRLITNNPAKVDHLTQLGVTISERLPLSSTVTRDNAAYLATKIQRMRHLLAIPIYTNGHNHTYPAGAGSPTQVDAQLANLQELSIAHYSETNLPYVTLSYAQTLDGTIASVHGSPLLISGHESMKVTHRLRAQHDAIMVGIGTLLSDDPQLTVRLVEGMSPQPIIVDSHLRTPLHARIWSNAKSPWIATLDATNDAAQMLRDRGARIIQMPHDNDNQIDLAALFEELGNLGIASVMVEGGASIIMSLLRNRLAHHAVITLAPRYSAGLRVNAQSQLTGANLHSPSYTQAGDDMIIWGQFNAQFQSSYIGHPTPAIVQNFEPAPLPTTTSPSISSSK